MNQSIHDKIVDLETLLPILARHRSAGKRIVQCHGCFDVVHPGHIRHLSDASDYGDVLLVSVTADPLVDKGVGRPCVPHELRCESLAALTMVDFVIVDSETWAGPILDRIRPDVYVKGLEYSTNNDPRFAREKEIVESHGGVVVYTSGEVVYSSSRLHQDQLDDREWQFARLKALLERNQITRDGLLARLRSFENLRVTIVGDPILDHYVECEQGGLGTEAPVLQVSPIDERYYVGGAGVLALHAAALGAKATYVGFLSPRRQNQPISVREQMERMGVNVLAIPTDGRLMKTRYLVEGQKVFKVDHCRPMAITSAQETAWLAFLEQSLAAGCEGLLAVDFGYGSITQPRMQRAAALAKGKGARVFADTSSSRYASLSKFESARCDAIFPNEAEARAYLGQPQAGLPILVSELFNKQLSDAIVLTLGSRGLVLFEESRQTREVDGRVRYLPEYVPPLTRIAVDALGAGDALTTTASLCRLAGGSHVESAFLGSVAAAIAVQRLGNEPVSFDAVARFLESFPLFSLSAS